jgi:hypothetical protein
MKAHPDQLLQKLVQLRTELEERAFTLDREGSREAADIAMTTSARVGELCTEFSDDRGEPLSGMNGLVR